MLEHYNIKPRLGAVGQHGSIGVTERVIKTLKYEWLRRVSIIKGFDHLLELCEEFERWYNAWRPHMALNELRPDDVYYDRKPKQLEGNNKTAPQHIEKHLFKETRITGNRLKNVALFPNNVTTLLLDQHGEGLLIDQLVSEKLSDTGLICQHQADKLTTVVPFMKFSKSIYRKSWVSAVVR